MSAETARTLVARQRVRNRTFIAVAGVAAILDAGVIIFLAAVATRTIVGAVVAGCVAAVLAAISLMHATNAPRTVRGRPPSIQEAAVLAPMAERLAEWLGVGVPVIWIAADDAVNVLSYSSEHRSVISYTEGFLAEFDLAEDRSAIEAVTAHALARAAAGDNALTVAASGLLDWALFLFIPVMAGLSLILGWLGVAFVKSDAHEQLPPDPRRNGNDELDRLAVWASMVFVGICLLAAAAVAVLIGGVLAVVATGVLMALARQRIRIADSITVELIGDPSALHSAFRRLAEIDQRPIDLTSKKRVLRALCFHGSSRYYPDLAARAAAIADPARTAKPGALIPVASGLALACLVAGVAVLTARVPYGQPIGTAVALGGQQATGTGNPAAGGGEQAGGAGSQQTPPSTDQSATGQTSPADGSPGNQSATSGQSPDSQSPGSQSSSTQSTAPPGVPPATPSGVTASADSQYQISVTWTGDASATGFNIDNGCPAGSCGGSDATLATSTGPASSASFAVTPGTYQCFRVQAFDDAGTSDWSGFSCASTPGLAVPGAQMWTDSGISVSSGDRLGLTAAGTIYIAGSDPGKSPAGDPGCLAAPSPPDTYTAPGLACWSLIARIGDGAPFEVGTSTEVTTTAGELYLGVNDNYFGDNSGNWTVRIKLGGMPPA